MMDERQSRSVYDPEVIYQKLSVHEERIDTQDARLDVHSEQIKQLQHNAIKLENLVMSENRETRQTIINTNSKLHDLINSLMDYKSGNAKIDTDFKIKRVEAIVKIIGILAGSGGILYYIFQ